MFLGLSNGILQGCPLSVIFINALISIWSKSIAQEVPNTSAESYADDTQALTKTRRSVTG